MTRRQSCSRSHRRSSPRRLSRSHRRPPRHRRSRSYRRTYETHKYRSPAQPLQRIPDSSDHYQVLGVERNAPFNTIKGAFHKMARLNHPDKNPNHMDLANENMTRIIAAYETLRDSRREYDRAFSRPNPATRPATRPATHPATHPATRPATSFSADPHAVPTATHTSASNGQPRGQTGKNSFIRLGFSTEGDARVRNVVPEHSSYMALDAVVIAYKIAVPENEQRPIVAYVLHSMAVNKLRSERNLGNQYVGQGTEGYLDVALSNSSEVLNVNICRYIDDSKIQCYPSTDDTATTIHVHVLGTNVYVLVHGNVPEVTEMLEEHLRSRHSIQEQTTPEFRQLRTSGHYF